MANRYFRQFLYTAEPAVVKLYARVTFGGTGAPTLDATNSKGVKSITRTSAGLYVFTFGTGSIQGYDNYNRLLGVTGIFVFAGIPAAPALGVRAEAVASAGTVTIQCNSTGTPAATDPASGEVLLIEFSLKNSTAP